MNSHLESTPSFGGVKVNEFQSHSKYTPIKLGNEFYNAQPFHIATPKIEQPQRFAYGCSDKRLLSDSKKTKFNDMKKNVCDRMLSRILTHRRERMDNILYYKPAIIEMAKNESYDSLAYFSQEEFINYVSEFFSEENLSFYFDNICKFVEGNETDSSNFEALVFQSENHSFCPICQEVAFQTKNKLVCSRNCFEFPIERKVNLDGTMLLFKIALKEHSYCGVNQIDIFDCGTGNVQFFCKKCMLN